MQIPFSVVWCAGVFAFEIRAARFCCPAIFGLLFVYVGLQMLIGRYLLDVWQRRNMLYALTDRRALMLSGPPGAGACSYRLERVTHVEFTDHRDGSGSIHFHVPKELQPNPSSWQLGGAPETEVQRQFEFIPDAGAVYEMIRGLRETADGLPDESAGPPAARRSHAPAPPARTDGKPPSAALDYSTPIDELLGPGETLLWTGQPRRGFLLRKSDGLAIPFTLAWCAIVFSFTRSAVRSRSGFGIMWSTPFVAAGIYALLGRFAVDALVRRNTWYGLTDRRAILVSGLFSCNTLSYDLGRVREIRLADRRQNGYGSIHFIEADSPKAPKRKSRPVAAGDEPSHSFDHIPDAEYVYQLIQSRLGK